MATGLGKRLLSKLPGGSPAADDRAPAPTTGAGARSAAAPGKGGTVVAVSPAAAPTPVKGAAVSKAPAKKAPAKAAKTAAKAPAKTAATAPVEKAPVKKAPVKKAPAKAPAGRVTADPPAATSTTPTTSAAAAAPRGTKTAARSAKVLPAVIPSGPLTGADAWSEQELAEVRRELDEQARELRGEIDDAEAASESLKRDQSSEGSGDEADAGTKTFEREHEMSLANNSRDLLLQVERALGRLDAGTYGRCETCGTPIPKARLQAFPRATLCVSCKQREERR